MNPLILVKFPKSDGCSNQLGLRLNHSHSCLPFSPSCHCPFNIFYYPKLSSHYITMKGSVQTTQAIVSHAPEDGKRKWVLEPVQVAQPEEYEAIVEMVASGVCHTDLGCGTAPDGTPGFPTPPYPRVLGHEGKHFIKLSPTLLQPLNRNMQVLDTFAQLVPKSPRLSPVMLFCSHLLSAPSAITANTARPATARSFLPSILPETRLHSSFQRTHLRQSGVPSLDSLVSRNSHVFKKHRSSTFPS